MAISFVGGITGGAVNAGDVTLDLTSLTGGSNSSPSEDDLVIVAYSVQDNDNVDFDMATLTSGYTEVVDIASTADTQDTNLGVFWKVMGASPDTSVQVDGPSTAGTDASVCAVALVFRGVDTTTPMDVTPTTATGINGHTADPPSIDHNNPSGVWTVAAGAGCNTSANAGQPTGATPYGTDYVGMHNATADDNSGYCGLAYSDSPSDPEDPPSWTISGSSLSAYSWCAATLALRPAPEATVVDAAAHGRTKGRATAVRDTATTQAAIQARAKGSSTATGDKPATEADATGRSKGRSQVAAIQQALTSIRSRGKGRSTATRAAFTLTVAAVGRNRSRARSAASTFAGAIPGAATSRGRGYSSASGGQSGIQEVIANSTDYLDMLMPMSPATYVEAQLVRARKPTSILQGVSHLFTLHGVSATPIVGQWSAEDDVLGGFGTAVGVISYKDVQKYRGVFRQGAGWRTYDSATGECIWAGRIRDVDRQQGGSIGITGRGWGQIITDRILNRPTVYAIYGTEGWVDATGEIGNFGDDDHAGSATANSGSLIFKWSKDPDRDDTETSLMIFEKPGATLSRIQFWVDATRKGTTDTGFDLFVYAGRTERFDDNGDLQTVYGQEDIIIPDDIGDRYEIDYDVPLDQDNSANGGPGDQLDYREPWDFVAISISQTSTGLTNGLKVKISDVRVLGEALQENELSAGQLVADVMAEKGLPTVYVENSGPDILPYTIEAGTPISEPLQFASLMARKRFVVRGERPTPIFSSPHDRRWWVYGEHHEVDLVPGERYDTILVPYTLGTTEHIYGFRKVQLYPSPLDRHNNFGALDWPVPVRVRQTSGSPFGIDDQRAEDLGYAILRQLVRPRRSGQGSLTEVVDAAGIRHSARMIQAGDQLRYVHGEFSGWLHVSKVTQFDDHVDVEFDDPISRFLERMSAKRQLKVDKKRG